MKRLFLSILVLFAALPLFAYELQSDFFTCDGLGFDTAFVFGSGNIKNSFGLYYDVHGTMINDEEYHNSSHSSSSSHSSNSSSSSSSDRYNPYFDLYSDSYGYSGSSGNSGSNSSSSSSSHRSSTSSDEDKSTHFETAQSIGLYYQFDWSKTFLNIGSVGLGINLPVQIGLGFDSATMFNIRGCLCPAVMFEFRTFDLFLGYKMTALLAEAVEGTPFIKHGCTVGIRYSFKKGGAKTASNISTSTKTEAPNNSSTSKVNVIPGSDIKTISN